MGKCGCGCSESGNMGNQKSGDLNDILNFAIEKEQEAADFYYDLAKKSKVKGIQNELTKFDQESSQARKTWKIVGSTSIVKAKIKRHVVNNC